MKTYNAPEGQWYTLEGTPVIRLFTKTIYLKDESRESAWVLWTDELKNEYRNNNNGSIFSKLNLNKNSHDENTVAKVD